MQRKQVAAICVFVLGILFCAGGLAQDGSKPTLYIYVGWWDLPRDKWADFVQQYEKYEMPVLNRLVDEGVLTEYGIDASGLHHPEGYTHSTWMVSTNPGNIERALDAYYESLGADADRLEAELAGMINRHMDLTFQSENYGSRSAKLSKGYFNGSSVRVQRGKGSEFIKLWKSRVEPVFEQLLKEETIVAYGLDEPRHHTSEDSLGQMVSWYVTESMDADVKVDAAFEASRADLSEAERTAQREEYWSLVVENSHRDDFTRLIHFRTK